MPATYQTILSFNGGELSPYLARRLDFEKYPTGVARLENFLPTPFGGVRKRPGTLHLADLSAETRLEPFTFDSSARYLLAFTTTNLKIYGTDGTLKDTIAATFSDPFALQTVNINDVVFIADPGQPPRRLSRVGDTSWTLEAIPFEFPPLLDQNLDTDHTLTIAPDPTPSAWVTSTSYSVDDIVESQGLYWRCHTAHTSASGDEPGVATAGNADEGWAAKWALQYFDVGDTIAVTASEATFDADHVGGTWAFDGERADEFFEAEVSLKGASGTTSTWYSLSIPIIGEWQVVTSGTWEGTVILQAATDGKTWEEVRRWTGADDRNVDETGTLEAFTFLRLKYEAEAGLKAGSPRAVVYPVDTEIRGLFEVTALNSATSVDGEVTRVLIPGTSYKWTPAAFDDFNGYPAAISVHERRLCFAGTTRNPVSLWLSKTDDLLDFETGTDATASIFVTLATTAQDPIRWLASQRRLMVGTSVSEWVVGSETSDAALTPENFNAREYTHYGSAALPAWRHNEGVFFVQRQARRFREIGYDITRETYDAADLTRLAEHITAGGIVQLDFQTGREPYVWAVLGTGTLLAFHYSRQERLSAWSRHTMADASFRSVAVLRSDSDDDDVFLVIERDSTYYLARFAADQQSVQEAGDADDPVHLDLAVTSTTSGAGILTGLDHLEGETVTFLADGIPSTATVSSGEIDTGRPSVTATAGLSYTSTLTTLPLDSGTPTGPSLGRMKRAAKILTDFYLTRGGAWTTNGQTIDCRFDTTSDLGDSTPSLFTGWVETNGFQGHRADLVLTFTHSRPWPCAIRAVSIQWETTEP